MRSEVEKRDIEAASRKTPEYSILFEEWTTFDWAREFWAEDKANRENGPTERKFGKSFLEFWENVELFENIATKVDFIQNSLHFSLSKHIITCLQYLRSHLILPKFQDEIDNLKQDFDKTRYLHTQQISELEEQVRELNEENVKLKQDISNDKHQVASSSFLRHKTMEEQLAKISEAIDETQRKRPRLDANDEQLKKKHTDEVAKLNTTVNALKTETGKKNAEILELQVGKVRSF